MTLMRWETLDDFVFSPSLGYWKKRTRSVLSNGSQMCNGLALVKNASAVRCHLHQHLLCPPNARLAKMAMFWQFETLGHKSYPPANSQNIINWLYFQSVPQMSLQTTTLKRALWEHTETVLQTPLQAGSEVEVPATPIDGQSLCLLVSGTISPQESLWAFLAGD